MPDSMAPSEPEICNRGAMNRQIQNKDRLNNLNDSNTTRATAQPLFTIKITDLTLKDYP